MPSLKDLRVRINSVRQTRKITSAMKLVAASKLRRAQEQAEASRPFAERMATAGRMHPRTASLEPHLAALLPELLMTVTPEQLAAVAARAMVPRQAPTVGLGHLHAPTVSVREQAGLLGTRLRRDRVASFRSLVADADSTLVVVARFLALLELFREDLGRGGR